jgi:hypothetical protein
MSENEEQQSGRKRKVGNAIPEILRNGPVFLFGFRRPPVATSNEEQTGPENADAGSLEDTAEERSDGTRTTKGGIPIVRVAEPGATAILGGVKPPSMERDLPEKR